MICCPTSLQYSWHILLSWWLSVEIRSHWWSIWNWHLLSWGYHGFVNVGVNKLSHFVILSVCWGSLHNRIYGRWCSLLFYHNRGWFYHRFLNGDYWSWGCYRGFDWCRCRDLNWSWYGSGNLSGNWSYYWGSNWCRFWRWNWSSNYLSNLLRSWLLDWSWCSYRCSYWSSHWRRHWSSNRSSHWSSHWCYHLGSHRSLCRSLSWNCCSLFLLLRNSIPLKLSCSSRLHSLLLCEYLVSFRHSCYFSPILIILHHILSLLHYLIFFLLGFGLCQRLLNSFKHIILVYFLFFCQNIIWFMRPCVFIDIFRINIGDFKNFVRFELSLQFGVS